MAYALVPGFDSAMLLSAVSDLDPAVKAAGKFIVAWPVAFHSFNGIRHLVWDAGYGLGIKGVYRSGYAVLGLSLVSALGLAGL